MFKSFPLQEIDNGKITLKAAIQIGGSIYITNKLKILSDDYVAVVEEVYKTAGKLLKN